MFLHLVVSCTEYIKLNLFLNFKKAYLLLGNYYLLGYKFQKCLSRIIQ